MKQKNPYLMHRIDFDLRQLEIFCKIVELKSFSKAAKEVYLAQASVSGRISSLESMIGAKLLDRLGRQVVPTRAGKLLYKHAVRLLEMKKAACQEMENFFGVKQGEIHIGGSTVPGEYILPETLGGFNKKYPLISVKLHIADSGETEKCVLQGKIELGVVGSSGNLHGNIISYELWNDELVIAVPKKHLWANKDHVSAEELFKEPFILREDGSGTLKIMESYLNSSKTKIVDSFNVVARFGSSTAVKEGIKAGLGISILSRRAVDTELKAGIFKILKLQNISMRRKFFLIRDKRRDVSPLCQAMLDFLLSAAKES